MKTLLMFLVLIVPLGGSEKSALKKSEVPKPMKVFVEIDGNLYEAVIDKKGTPHPKELADASIQKRFRNEARRFGVAYLQNTILLEKKSLQMPDKAGP